MIVSRLYTTGYASRIEITLYDIDDYRDLYWALVKDGPPSITKLRDDLYYAIKDLGFTDKDLRT
jgi:hypothetical protein